MESDRVRCRTRVRFRAAFRLLTVVTLTLAAWSFTSAEQKEKDDKDDKGKRASLSLRVSPAIAFSPARVVASAELRGGSPDDAALYCPRTEWDWGDGTRSEANENCEPFEAGKSEIKRRWTASHTYTTQGNYRVQLRLKRGDRTVAAGNTNLQIKPGARDYSSPFDQP
jgi:PKD domain